MSPDARPASASHSPKTLRKPKALKPGARLSVVSPASPGDESRTEAGLAELRRLGFTVVRPGESGSFGYFAAPGTDRREEFLTQLRNAKVEGLIALRGGYGSNYLLDGLNPDALAAPKCLVGFSDLTSLQIFLWERCGWITFYGPMVAAGFDAAAGSPRGFDEVSLRRAVSETRSGWTLALHGETMTAGETEGRLLGGCLTLLEATIGTPWELNTNGAILVLEDRAMKPYQVDRVLMHLKQAGKLAGVRGIVFGDFPECAPPVPGSWTVADVCRRVLGGLGIPIVWGAPVGHTERPMLTLPLGVSARLRAEGAGTLEILEPAVVE
jgi:muramoyltetrapeptide carboxypeptidase